MNGQHVPRTINSPPPVRLRHRSAQQSPAEGFVAEGIKVIKFAKGISVIGQRHKIKAVSNRASNDCVLRLSGLDIGQRCQDQNPQTRSPAPKQHPQCAGIRHQQPAAPTAENTPVNYPSQPRRRRFPYCAEYSIICQPSSKATFL